MRNLAVVFLAGFLGLSCSASKTPLLVPQPSIENFQNVINEEGLRADLTILASDSLEGRATGTRGLDLAADYLAKRYASIGLDPVGDDDTYFQHFDLNQPIINGYEYQVFDSNGNVYDESSFNEASLGNFRTWWPGTAGVQGEVVFVGYGIKNETVNQYPEEAKGKWLLAFFERSNYSTIQQQVTEKEALGMILIMDTDDDYFIKEATDMQAGFGNPGSFSLKYLEDESIMKAAVHMIKPGFAAEILGVENADELAEEIKMSPAGFNAQPTGYEFIYHQDIEENVVSSKNVVAFIEGTDSTLKNEVIVLSSHYDHIGIGVPDSTGDTINNGADDDGSGTVGLLHVAQALTSAKQAGADLKRSVLILHVAAEEVGLLGSRYYSDHPIFAIENTIANLNVDMIGRRDPENADNPNYVYVIGGKIVSSGLQQVMEEANSISVDLELSDRYNDLEDPNRFYRRSDHWNFGRLGVPFVFFFNGTHADYHRPSDEVDKIDFEALKNRSKLIFMTTALLANADERPEVDNEAFILKTRE